MVIWNGEKRGRDCSTENTKHESMVFVSICMSGADIKLTENSPRFRLAGKANGQPAKKPGWMPKGKQVHGSLFLITVEANFPCLKKTHGEGKGQKP